MHFSSEEGSKSATTKSGPMKVQEILIKRQFLKLGSEISISMEKDALNIRAQLF